MQITSIDHIVLVVQDITRCCAFYRDVLGLTPVEDPPGRWSLKFGSHKISLQQEASVPEIAQQTLRGSGNFCLLTDTPMDEVVARLGQHQVAIVEGPAIKQGATGPIRSVYFYDIDGNLVEVANLL